MSNAYGSGLMALLHAAASYLADMVVILIVTWAFGASALTSLTDNIILAFMLAVLMRESITICKVPAAPRISANIKAVSEQDRSTGESDEVTRPRAARKPMTEEEKDDIDANQMPGRLEQGPCLFSY